MTPEVLEGRLALAVTDHAGRVRLWPAEHWKELARLWAGGAAREAVVALFMGRGYHADDVPALITVLAAAPHVLTPLERALFVLGGQAARDPAVAGGFRLGTRPARPADVVRQANRVLFALGLPEIRYPAGAGA